MSVQEQSVPIWDMTISHPLAFLKQEPAVVDYAITIGGGLSTRSCFCFVYPHRIRSSLWSSPTTPPSTRWGNRGHCSLDCELEPENATIWGAAEAFNLIAATRPRNSTRPVGPNEGWAWIPRHAVDRVHLYHSTRGIGNTYAGGPWYTHAPTNNR